MSALTAPLRRPRPAATGSGRPDLRVVEEPRRRHPLAFTLLTIFVLAGAVFGTVSLNALAAASAVEARALETRVAEAERAYAQQVADVAALEDPARIAEAAEQLGLVSKGPGRHVVLDRNLPADGAVTELVDRGAPADPLKPVLSVEP